MEYEGTGRISTEGLFDTVVDWDVRGRYASGVEFTLKTGGEINPKYPGGSDGAAKRLRAEGHKIVAKGRRTFVDDHKKYLFTKFR